MIPEEPPRRRRVVIDDSGPQGPRRFPVWLLVPVVIVFGLALGAGLAKYIGRSQQTTSVAETVVVTPVPSASIAPSAAPATPEPSPSVTPRATALPTSTPRVTPTPRATATPRPTQAPTESPAPSAAPTTVPTPKATPKSTPAPTVAPRKTEPIARRPAPVETAAPAPVSPAVGVVQAYLENLRRGNFAGATQYLANGDPSETFIESSSRIGHFSSRPNDDGSTHVTADVTTSHGTYFLTFKVEATAAGERITEHTAIKPGF